MDEEGFRSGAARDAPRISVIIATRDRPEDLARCLQTVLGCDHDSFEVVVVDQSDPASPVPHDSRVLHLPTSTRGKSAALNIGLAAVRAELIAFTDDDCTVPSDWLTRVDQLFADYPNVALVFGELRPVAHDPSQVFVPWWKIGEFEIVHRVQRGQIRGGAGANMAARRAVFEAIGLWDEQIGPGSRFRSCEEGDIIFRALTSGHAVARVPELWVTHWGGRPWADGSGQMLQRSYAYGRGALMGKHLRLGDRHMVPVAAREMVEDLWAVARGFAHPRRSGIAQVAYKWRGLAEGLIAPVDRSHHVFAQPKRPDRRRAAQTR